MGMDYLIRLGDENSNVKNFELWSILNVLPVRRYNPYLIINSTI
jgi:hypothetical protein